MRLFRCRVCDEKEIHIALLMDTLANYKDENRKLRLLNDELTRQLHGLYQPELMKHEESQTHGLTEEQLAELNAISDGRLPGDFVE